ncbi:MAG: sulfatase-like hydrolase/transferase [bacterium]|nr:sulfatase-like hydrolase/transferase [bacterium]
MTDKPDRMKGIIDRRDFLKLAGAGVASLALSRRLAAAQTAAPGPSSPAPGGSGGRKPNVIFILADDLGWRDTSLYGSKFFETPNIELLAQRGMMFTNAYAANPLCSPTRSSIMTGLWPARTGITTPSCHVEDVILEKDLMTRAAPARKAIVASSVTRLKLEYFTLAESLHEAGYATGHFGKWHLGRDPYNPQHQGFDVDIPHWFGPNPPAYLSPWKFSTWAKTPWKVPYDDGKPGEDIEDRMGDEVVKFIRAHKDGPFYVNYWCFSVHGPWQGKPELVEKYRKKADPDSPQHHPIMGAMIETMDDNVGKVLRALDELGVADNTIIVFFGDNGGVHWPQKTLEGYENVPITSNAPLRGGKATLYEGGTREPCVVVWPGVTPPGSKSDEVVSSVDFYPTLVGAIGARIQKDQPPDGVDILPALKGGTLAREAIFCHFPHTTGVPDGGFPGTWVRKGDWKLIRCYCDSSRQTDRYELYNLKDDIGETKNLADAMPDRVKELDALIARFLRETKAVIPIPNPAYDPAAEARAAARKKG